MASPLDLQEQEQLDELKAFWSKYGNLITWTLALILGAVALYNGWNWWQRREAEQAAVVYDQLVKAAKADDAATATSAFNQIKDRHGRTAYAANAGLLAAKVQAGKGQTDEALKSLGWVVDNARDDEVKLMARLGVAGLHMDKKQWDEALKQLDAAGSPAGTLGALVADRRADILWAQGKADDAKVQYEKAYAQMDAMIEYRQLIEAKLAALGVAAPAAAASGAKP